MDIARSIQWLQNGGMHQFLVSDDGAVHEVVVDEWLEHLRQQFPDLDYEAWQSQVMMERTYRLLAGLRDTEWNTRGLTPRRFILLRLLYTSKEKRLSMGEIATQMNLAANNATQLVAGLERDGYLTRETGDEDKRLIYALLSKQGEGIFAEVFPEKARMVSKAWSGLSDTEKSVLSHLLAKLRMHLLTTDSHLRELDYIGSQQPRRATANLP